MRKMSVICVLILLTGYLLANQEIQPSKGRFDYFPQIPQRVSKLDQPAKDSSRYTLWTTSFPNNHGWSTPGNWQVGIATMGPDTVPGEDNCLATNLHGFYLNNADDYALSPNIQIPSASYVELSLVEWFELESDYDFGWVLIKHGNEYHSVDARSGVSDGWRTTSIDITRWAGESIQVALRFTSDYSVPALGWYIDSIAIDLVEPVPLSLDIIGINIANLPSVYLNAAVNTPDGPLLDLDQSNFTVWENSVQQQDMFSVIAPDNDETFSGTDIVFVLDVTGSMGQEINSVRANMQSFMNHLQSQNIDYRIGFVVFGDIIYVYNQYSFYTDFSAIMNIINSISLGEHGIGSGGDMAENPLEAMAAGSAFSWRPGAARVMILLTDAHAHESDHITDWTVNDLLAERLLPNEVMVFPIFNVIEPAQMTQYLPIAQQTNYNGTYYHIYDNFDEIIAEIGDYIASLYTLHYVSPVPEEDQMSRIVRLEVSDGISSSEDTKCYLPGLSPTIARTTQLESLDHNPVESGQALDFELMIWDRVPPGLQSQAVMWRRVGSDAWTLAPLMHSDEDIYLASLPATEVTGVGIEYYIVASDGQTTVTLPSAEPYFPPFSIPILPAQPVSFGTPHIIYPHEGPFSIRISATSDLDKELKLYHRPLGSLVYEETLMMNHGSSFICDIDQGLGNLGLQYFITATQTNQLVTTLGTFDQPLFVEPAIPSPEIYSGNGYISSLKAWPNPLSNQSRGGYLTISFNLRDEAFVKAEVFNLRGQLIRTLAKKELSAGQHSLWWDTRDDSDRRVSSGVYTYRLEAGDKAVFGKILITH